MMKRITILLAMCLCILPLVGCFGNTGAFIASGTGLGVAIGATPLTPNLVLLGGDFNLAVIDVDAAQEAVTITDKTFYDLTIGADVGESEGANATGNTGKQRDFSFKLEPVEDSTVVEGTWGGITTTEDLYITEFD